MENPKKRVYKTYPAMQKINTVRTYEEQGWKAACDLEYVPRSTIYRWVKLKKSGRKNWERGLSKRPKNLHNQKINKELIAEIISLKQENPKMPYKQIVLRISKKLSEPTICRVWRRYKQIKRLVGALENVKNKKLTGTFEIPVSSDR